MSPKSRRCHLSIRQGLKHKLSICRHHLHYQPMVVQCPDEQSQNLGTVMMSCPEDHLTVQLYNQPQSWICQQVTTGTAMMVLALYLRSQ